MVLIQGRENLIEKKKLWNDIVIELVSAVEKISVGEY